MRNLFILRGAPASGKSTWIKENNLEPYTLSADTIRLLYQSPVTTNSGELAISQNNDGNVWKLLYQLLENRMKRGEFIVIDATHYKSALIARYKDLVEKYRYRVNVVDFSNVSEEELLRRNSERDQYKKVPEEVIQKMVVALADSKEVKKAYKILSPQEASEMLKNPLEPVHLDVERVVIFGDIHGCYDPLKTYFDKTPYNENYCYIFCGDYLDRGPQNKEVLEFLIELSKKPNVYVIEGNHEKWLKIYSSKDYKEGDRAKITEYKDLQVCKVLNDLSFISSKLENKLKNNKAQSEKLSELLKQSWEENPNNKEVFYMFEKVNVPQRQGELKEERNKISAQLKEIERLRTLLKYENQSTKRILDVIKYASEDYDFNISFNSMSLLKKEYNLELGDLGDSIKSREFLNNTLPQIKGIDKVQIREFCRRLIQMSYFTLDGNSYFVCHGGLPCLPTIFTPTQEMINGVGEYEDHELIDEMFCKNTNLNTYQIHGHRNVLQEPFTLNFSANLEGGVEDGGCLRILEIYNKNTDYVAHNCIEIKNDNFIKKEQETQEKKSDLEVLKGMSMSKWVQVKELKDDVCSFNFTRDAFEKGKWDTLTCTARGLFIDKKTGDVVARSYNKFFNYKQHEETKPENMIKAIKWPLVGYKKENGFLGILSKYKGKLKFFTKSSDDGDYVNWFIGILCANYGLTEYSEAHTKLAKLRKMLSEYKNERQFQQPNELNYEYIKELELGIKNCKEVMNACREHLNSILSPKIMDGHSYVFEVVDVENDPHIIMYDKSNVILLEVFENKLEEKHVSYDELIKIANLLDVQVKKEELRFNDWESFEQWKETFTKAKTQWQCAHEGYVFEDAQNFRVKFKSRFYQFWKEMRAVKDILANGRANRKTYKTKEEIQVVKLLESHSRDELKAMSIIDVENEFYSQYFVSNI